MLLKNKKRCHSRAGGIPFVEWSKGIPAYAGMTGYFIF
jgi:hypothetical protein